MWSYELWHPPPKRSPNLQSNHTPQVFNADPKIERSTTSKFLLSTSKFGVHKHTKNQSKSSACWFHWKCLAKFPFRTYNTFHAPLPPKTMGGKEKERKHEWMNDEFNHSCQSWTKIYIGMSPYTPWRHMGSCLLNTDITQRWVAQLQTLGYFTLGKEILVHTEQETRMGPTTSLYILQMMKQLLPQRYWTIPHLSSKQPIQKPTILSHFLQN